MRVAHFADIHLGKNLYRFLEVEEDIARLFAEYVQKAIEERVDAILLSGDIFHVYRPLNRVIHQAVTALRPAAERGIKIYAVLGDHDYPKRKDKPALVLVPGVTILNYGGIRCVKQEVGGKTYGFCGIHKTFFRQDLGLRRKYVNTLHSMAKEVADTHRAVVLAHQEISQVFANSDDAVDVNLFPQVFRYIALGHIHGHREGVLEGGRVYAYPGSIYYLDAGEVKKGEEKGFLIVDLDGDMPETHFVRADPRPFIVVDEPVDRVKARIEAELSRRSWGRYDKPLMKIVVRLPPNYRGDVNISSAIKKAVAGRALYRVEIKSEKEEILGTVNAEVDEVEVVASVIDPKHPNDPEVKKAAEYVIKLKNVLAQQGGQESIDELVESILSLKVWDKVVKTRELRAPLARRKGGKGLGALVGGDREDA